MLANGTWDIRCPAELKDMFPRPRRGYWYKVNRDQARRIVAYLAAEYGCSIPNVSDKSPGVEGLNGAYRPSRKEIMIWARAHVKTVFHEFYHHLDFETDGEYDSSDWPEERRKLSRLHEQTGYLSLAWKFADRMFAAMH